MIKKRIGRFSKRRRMIVQVISMINAFLSILWAGIAYSMEIKELPFYLSIASILFFLAAAISKKGNAAVGRLIFILTFNLSITVASSFIGKHGSVEFFLMFGIGLPFVIFSFRREKYLVFIFAALSIILWGLLYFTNFDLFTSKHLNTEIAQRIIYPISITTTLLLVTFQLIYFSYVNAKFNTTIHSKKQQALDASNAKSKFLSTMSHEIRTPLNAVIGLSHILGDNGPRKDQADNIEALNYSGKILLNLLNNVLDFSKMQSTEIDLDNIPTDLSLAIKQIKKVHEASCLRKGIFMSLEIDKDIPIVWLDVVRFNQVINNLVTNAIKFTENGGITLKIKKVSQSDEKVKLLTEVIDTGIGIPKDKQETIWEAFTQASSETNRLYGGTGLGLPIVKSIVESMGSNVKIESFIGHGSRFYFEVELNLASKNELMKSTTKKERNFNRNKVLLVEDNLINIMVCQQILEKVNLDVTVVHDGLSAVNSVRDNSYDVVLMDIQMPIMDGYSASKEIRKFNENIPILALSASVFIEVKERMAKSGMNGFIYKPFDPEDLMNQIENVLQD
jgi:signal transduction histidine kinase